LIRSTKAWIAVTVAALLLASTPIAAAGSAKGTTKTAPQKKSVTSAQKKRSSARRRVSRRGSWKRRGQKQIASERVREIQQALVREKYLDAQPNGIWDERTKAAMTRYQADHGWQSKITPDSRALISLGLGPSLAGLLNPTTAILPVAPAAGGGEVEQIEEEEQAIAEESEPETRN
jgi:peptidoglycan hydrolase-like protein with peptidoglycan-binding domain